MNRGRGQRRRGSVTGNSAACLAAAAVALEGLERVSVGAGHLLDDVFGLLPVAGAAARLQGCAIREGVVRKTCFVFQFRPRRMYVRSEATRFQVEQSTRLWNGTFV